MAMLTGTGTAVKHIAPADVAGSLRARVLHRTGAAEEAVVRVDIWSDVVCPWCYIGKRRFERALEDFVHVDSVDLVHRAFQLNPSWPQGTTVGREVYLMKKFGWSAAEAQEMNRRMEKTAAGDQIEYNLDGTVVGNTRDAHRLLVVQTDHELQGDLLERFYRAHFTERRSLFERESLVKLAAEGGMSPDRAWQVLTGDEGIDLVERDLADAGSLGVTGVPYFLLDGRYGISGAQPRAVLTDAITRAWDKSQGMVS
jgi:predicted DsbA family dithiol-disulfide isomerase